MWSPAPTIGGAQWQGNATLATTRQLNNISTTLTNQLLSTSAGLYTYTYNTSNYLQTEINAIVVGGGASLWANFGAIHDVDISGYKITNAKIVSTQELFTSSINGNDVNFFGSTITVGGVTFVGGTVTTSNITVQPAKGGGGGGGNNPTQGGSGNNTFTMVNNAVGAVMDTVSKTQQAISGVLNNTGAVLFQTYYAVETAGAIIDLANGAVQLATNAQAMYDTREQNLISGPSGPPGQTSYVYETINGTTQLQFSTLGAPVYSVFRTTDQVDPNKTFGREIFTSTIIPAGSKVVRSVSDPYQFPFISTQAISTTNYLQSFGQWHSIIEPDYNLKTSTLTASSIQSYFGNISTLTVSSINGIVPSNYILPPGIISTPNLIGLLSTVNLSSFFQISTPLVNASSISTNYLYALNSYINNLSVSTLTASTLVVQNIIDNYVSTTTGRFDILNTSTLNANVIETNSLAANILQATTLLSESLSLTISTGNSFSAIYPTNSLTSYVSAITIQQSGFYNFETNAAPSPPASIVYINNPDFVWVYDTSKPYGTTNPLQQGVLIQPGYAGTPSSGTFIFYAVGSAGFNVEFIQQGDGLAPAAAPYTVLPGWYVKITYSYTPGEYQPATYTVASLYTPIAGSATSTLTNSVVSLVTDVYETVLNTSNTFKNSGVTTTGLGNLALNVSTIAFGSNTSRNNTIPFQFNGLVNPTGIVFTTPPSGAYDIVKSFASTTTQNYNAVSSLTQNILNYNLSATAASEGIIDFGVSFVCNSANVADWNQQVLTTSYIGDAQIALFNLNTTAYFDVFRSGPYPITVYDWRGGAPRALFIIYPTNTITYRVTGTVSGATTTWTYTTSPGTGGTFTTTNNLTISQDLQNVYVSTLNRIQFNAGDIYMNGSLIAPTAFIDNLYGRNTYFSTISTLNLNIGNIQVQNEIIGDLVITNNISCANQVAVLQADGNAALVRAFEIYTKYPNSTGDPVSQADAAVYGPYWDTITSVKMLTSQMTYNVWDGYVNTGLGYVSNITFDSNFDLYVNNTYLGRPTNKGSLAFTAVAYNGSLGTYPGCLLRTLTTLPASLGTALNAYTLTLSNSSGAGGTDYVTLYGGGWNPAQIGNIYMPTYSTGNPAIIYNQAGSNTISILAGSPGTPFPNTTTTAVTDIVGGLTHVAGGPNNGILVVGAPNLWFGGTCNIDMRWGNNGYLSFNQKKSYNFTINGSYSDGPHGYINTNNGKNSADYNGAISFNGQTFNYADYSCTVSMAGIHLQKVGDAIDQVNVWCQNNGGLWWLYCYLEVQAYAGEPQNNPVAWDVTVTLAPKGVFAGSGLYDLSGSPILSSINTGLTYLPSAFVSSMVASTVTIQATENASLLAGGFTVPTYLSTGSITVAGTSQVSLLANIVAIGAQTDVDIQANSGNVNVVGGSNIILDACNYLQINSGSYMNTDVYGDMTTNLGGVYTITSAEVINLNGSNGVGLNSSNAINLTATSNVNINTVTTIQIPGTASIQSVSPLALTNGNDYAGTSRSQIEFQFYGGGFNHYISSRHNANVTYDSGNAIDFWLYSVNTGGDAQTASSAPGTGNVNVMSITASNVVINRPIQISDPRSGGTGTLTVDSGNHLYWNGTLIA